MARLLGVSTGTVKIWYHAGIVRGSGITTKVKSSTTRPVPIRLPATKDAGTTPCDLHERHLAVNRSEEVQYATRGFMRGAWGAVSSTSMPTAVNTVSKALVNLASRSRIRCVMPGFFEVGGEVPGPARRRSRTRPAGR